MTINQQKFDKSGENSQTQKIDWKMICFTTIHRPFVYSSFDIIVLFLFSSTISIVVILHKAGVILATAQYLFGKNHGCHR